MPVQFPEAFFLLTSIDLSASFSILAIFFLSQEALKKHDAIINALKGEAEASKERLDYLQSINILLMQAIKDLKADLGKN